MTEMLEWVEIYKTKELTREELLAAIRESMRRDPPCVQLEWK